MTTFLLRRLGSGVVLVLVVTFVTAMAIFANGENIARNLAGQGATAEQIALVAERHGLDRPAVVQYVDWLTSALSGDFGRSFQTSEPVGQALANRLPATLSLLVVAVTLTAILAALLGVVAAVRRGWVDRVVQVFNVIASALPSFWVGITLVGVFAINLAVLPATGFVPISRDPGAWAQSLVLPVTALLVGSLGSAALVRSSVIDVLRLDYVRTLRAHGLSTREVLFRHVLRNAAPPYLSMLSMQVIGLFGGAVVIERVFAINGMGSLANPAAQIGDVPVVLGVVAATVTVIVVVNLALDLANGWLNPKVRVR